MTPDKIVDITSRLKGQRFWPHEPDIAEDAADALRLIEHLENQIVQQANLIDRLTHDDSRDLVIKYARENHRFRGAMARVLELLEEAPAAVRAEMNGEAA